MDAIVLNLWPFNESLLLDRRFSAVEPAAENAEDLARPSAATKKTTPPTSRRW